MIAETISQRPTTSGGDDNVKNPPPPEIFDADGEGDDYYSIRDGLDKLETMLRKESEPVRSVTDGWEERARDAQPHKGYPFGELDKHEVDIRRGIGTFAVQLDRNRGSQSYGMPEYMRVNTRAQKLGRQAIARF